MIRRRSRAAPFLSLLLLLLPLCLPGCAGRTLGTEPSGAPAEAWSALYRCRILREGTERSFRAAILAGPPDRFRIELFGPVGGARLLLASDGSRLSALLPGERLQAEARADARSFQVLVGIPLEGADLLALLDGRLVAGPGGDDAAAQRTRRLAGGGEARFRVERGPAGEISAADVSVEGGGIEPLDFRVVYGPRRQTGAGPFPSEVRLSRQDRALILELREARRREAPDGAFRLAPPPGFQAGGIEELAASGVVLFGDG